MEVLSEDEKAEIEERFEEIGMEFVDETQGLEDDDDDRRESYSENMQMWPY